MKLLGLFLVLSMLITLNSCRQNTVHQHQKPTNKRQLNFSKINTSSKTSLHNDTLTINKKSAVSFFIDTTTLNTRRKKYGDTAYYTGADDDVYFSEQAALFLKKQRLPLLNGEGYKYLKFIGINSQVTLVKIDTLTAIYNLYLFDPVKKPYKADITATEDEYMNYFR